MLSKNHYLDLAEGKFKGTTAADLGPMFAALEQGPVKDHIVVHLHGGLVSRTSAEQSAEVLQPYYEAGGAYPVFFFWRSDLWSVLQHNMADIAKEDAFKRLVKRLMQLAVGKLANYAGARSGGVLVLPSEATMPDDLEGLAGYAATREPTAGPKPELQLSAQQIEQAEAELETDEILQEESQAIVATVVPPAVASATRARAGGAPVTPKPSLMSKNVKQELAAEVTGPDARAGILTFLTLAKHGIVILKNVIVRFAKGRAHGIYTTIVEEVLRDLYLDSVGAIAWETMKGDTVGAFKEDPQVYGGTAFLQHLKAWWRPGRRITLVCHSAGAIYGGNFLTNVDRVLPADAKLDVVYLAPACTFETMASLLPVFAKRVRRFRMYALSETLESGYWEVPVIYPASLLYMVSGLFEGVANDMPIVGMQRYYTDADPYIAPEIQQVTKFLQGKCVWSVVQGGPGWSSAATRHGGFTGDEETCKSLRDFLRSTEDN